MKRVFAIALCVAPFTAHAAGPEQGTFAGEKPRGQSVSQSAHNYNDAGSNYGQTWAEPRTEEPHNQPDTGSEVANDIQGHLSQSAEDNNNGQGIVGYGRGYPTK